MWEEEEKGRRVGAEVLSRVVMVWLTVSSYLVLLRRAWTGTLRALWLTCAPIFLPKRVSNGSQGPAPPLSPSRPSRLGPPPSRPLCLLCLQLSRHREPFCHAQVLRNMHRSNLQAK